MKKMSEAIGAKVTAHDLRRTFKAMSIENGIEQWKFDLLINHQLADVSGKHYLETSDLQYFRPEVNTITDWVVKQGRIAKTENMIPMAGRKKA